MKKFLQVIVILLAVGVLSACKGKQTPPPPPPSATPLPATETLPPAPTLTEEPTATPTEAATATPTATATETSTLTTTPTSTPKGSNGGGNAVQPTSNAATQAVAAQKTAGAVATNIANGATLAAPVLTDPASVLTALPPLSTVLPVNPIPGLPQIPIP